MDYTETRSFKFYVSNDYAAPASPLYINDSFTFGTYYFKGQTIIGSCQEWNQFTSVKMSLPFESMYFEAISTAFSYYNYDRNSTEEGVTTCRNENVIAGFVSAMRSGVAFEGNCNGDTWRVFTCARSRVFCVNCKKICVETEACPGTSQVVNPCNRNCAHRAGAAALLNVQYATRALYPIIDESPALMATATSSTSISIVLNISKAGFVRCAAFPSSSSSSTTTLLTSVADISQYGMYAYRYTPGWVTVEVTGLDPSTMYDTYCYSEDFRGNFMPLSLAVSSTTRRTLATQCCRMLSVVSADAMIPQYFAGTSKVGT